ncbi:MAG: NACHT domain-containing protein [Planctomycetes bacterium]|nr:NACHT domain-containing protein [Planctomycetota bacterium]
MVVTPLCRRRPVFVTSTLRDMPAEREWLRTSVFPELARRLGERHHQLEPIDLRRGVEADTPERQESAELQALEVGLTELERAGGLQIVLVGDRYGWTVPEEHVRAAAEEAGFEVDAAGKSVFALEVEFGLRGSLGEGQQCFFYFREPLDCDRMPPELAAEYSNDPNADRLAELKGRIEQEMPDRVRHYRAEWDEENGTVTGLDDFGRMVLEDLWRVLDAETDADAPPPGWQVVQQELLVCFVAGRQQAFVGRAKVVDQLVGLAGTSTDRDGAWGACVVGAPGVGKSALFARVHGAMEQKDVILLAHAAGIGARSIQVDWMLRRWVWQLARSLETESPIGEGSTSREVEAAFAELLSRASESRRVVLLVDGLDQFEPTPRAERLAWLPKAWPENARLIATTRSGETSEALERRGGVELISLGPVDAEEIRQIAESVGRRRRRDVDPEVLDELSGKRLPGGTASAGLPLWLETVAEELCLVDSGASVLDVARQLPPDVESLYDWMLKRNEERLGSGWAKGFVNLIAASRNGLRESDFEVLLPKIIRLFEPTAPREPWDGLRFAVLRRAFRPYLVQCGPEGLWDFCHGQPRESIRRRSLRDPQLVQRLHTSIAYHLKSLPSSDPLRQTELMVHLIESEDRLRAAHHYSGELPEGELAGATQALADHILAGSGQTPNTGLAWTASLLIEPKLKKAQVGMLCRRFNFELLEALANNAPIDARRRLADATRQAAEELVEQEPENPQWQQESAASYQRLATFHEETGNQAEAESCRRRCQKAVSALKSANVALDRPVAELLNELDAHG